MKPDEALERLLEERPEAPPPIVKRKPSTIGEAELVAALRENQWKIANAADALKITRSSLHMLIDKSDRIRKAKDVPQDELRKVYEETGGDLQAMADKLRVSPRGLRNRVKELK
jgi:two-component system nitrogen regulation response regulator GlnG